MFYCQFDANLLLFGLSDQPAQISQTAYNLRLITILIKITHLVRTEKFSVLRHVYNVNLLICGILYWKIRDLFEIKLTPGFFVVINAFFIFNFNCFGYIFLTCNFLCQVGTRSAVKQIYLVTFQASIYLLLYLNTVVSLVTK